MPEVFKNTENFIKIDKEWLSRLKREAEVSVKHLSRLCMHRDTQDLVQEMILCFTSSCLISPNSAPGKSESLTVLEGEMLLVLFDDHGQVSGRVEMGPAGSNKVFMYRLCSAGWHTMIPLTDFVIVHECIEGPFVKSTASLPGWVPTKPEELKIFISQIVLKDAHA